MRSENPFAALIFFTILSIVSTTILNSVLLSQTSTIKALLQGQQGQK